MGECSSLDPEEVETAPAARAATSSDGVVSVTPKTGSPFELAANRFSHRALGAGRRHGVSATARAAATPRQSVPGVRAARAWLPLPGERQRHPPSPTPARRIHGLRMALLGDPAVHLVRAVGVEAQPA